MTTNADLPYPPTVVDAVMTRYADAFLSARLTNGIGITIKNIGLGTGLAIGSGGVLFAMAIMGIDGVSVGTKIMAAIFIVAAGATIGAIAGALIYLQGVLIAAQGQTLKASLDSAVHSSPFLSASDMARVMTLPLGAQPAGVPASAMPIPISDWRCACGQNNSGTLDACLDCGIRRGEATA